MKVHPKIRIPGPVELALIADDLGVPVKMKPDFITWIKDLAEILDECRVTLNDPYAGQRAAREALKSAEQALARAASEIRGQSLFLDMVTSTDLQSGLDVLLGRDAVTHLAILEQAISDSSTDPGTLSSALQTSAQNRTVNVRTARRRYDAPYDDLSRLISVLGQLVGYELRTFKSRGGRPEDRIRRQIFKELLELYRGIFSEPATSAPNGRYGRLCQHVFESFDIPTEGLDVAIKRFLKSVAASHNVKPSGS
jgi:hypothetical protein